MAHIGFTPQHVHQLGGYKIQGKSEIAQENLLNLALQLEEMGAFAPVRDIKNRHKCVTLAFEASVKALSDKG